MADQRDGGIAWTDQTWNPVRGCSRVSEGCRNCYAESVARRFSGPGQPYEGLADAKGWTRKVRLVPERLGDPLRWRRPRRVFVNSMSDLFHESLPFEHIAAIFGVMAAAPQHTFQVLTKRPERAAEFFAWIAGWAPMKGHISPGNAAFKEACEILGRHEGMGLEFVPWYLPNVWLGVSVENQKTADERVPVLLRLPAAVRFVSYEPALGPVDFTNIETDAEGGVSRMNALVGESYGARVPTSMESLDWLIVGGESGPAARPFDIAWARQAIAQCREAGVACFVKQLGAHPLIDLRYDRREPSWTRRLTDRAGANPDEWPADLRVREFPRAANTQGGA